MKKIIIAFAIISAFAFSAIAQNNSHMHVFRNDNTFHSHKGRDIENIVYSGFTEGYTTMTIKHNDGTTKSVEMSAIDSVVVRPIGIPDIHVNLLEYPYIEDLLKDNYHTKSTIYPAILRIDGNGYMDDLKADTVEFRGRGNSTWNMKKTPYRFKMKKKQGLAGMPKAKTFALIANFIDCTLMRNVVALWVARYLGMPFSNHAVPVNVYLNGNYRGAYMMTEKIGTGSGSVDIDEYQGLLFELDSNFDEDYKFGIQLYGDFTVSTNYMPYSRQNYLPVMVKDPDLTEICDSLEKTPNEILNIWSADFREMVKAVMTTPLSGSLSKYIDVEQAANFFIVNGLANNHEMQHPKSFYIHKENLEGVYKFGPVWDFDWAFTFNGTEGASPTVPLVTGNGDCGGYTFLSRLFANEEFRTIYKNKLNSFISEGYPQLLAYMENYANIIEPSAKNNGLKWPYEKTDSYYQPQCTFNHKSNLNTLYQWLDNRINYMKNHRNFGLYE